METIKLKIAVSNKTTMIFVPQRLPLLERQLEAFVEQVFAVGEDGNHRRHRADEDRTEEGQHATTPEYLPARTVNHRRSPC